MSVLGILVYMVSVGYEGQNKKKLNIEVDIDLGAVQNPIAKIQNKIDPNMDSFIQIPSVS